jgi:tRNA-2-methylthio-N6-dimethylallyladenosine synthase
MAFKYFTRVFGCQMNVSDADELDEMLKAAGGVRVEAVEDADLALVNTCVVRQKAEDKAYSYLGTLGALKAKGRPLFVAVMGCIVPKEKAFIARSFPYVDLLVDYSIPGMVMSALAQSFPPMRNGSGEGEADVLAGVARVAGGRAMKSAFVTVIRGCNCRCSYCIVPYVRGSERSIAPDTIVEQVQRRLAAGHREVVLLGQNVLAYGGDAPAFGSFPDLMERVIAETDAPWLSFLTSHPKDLDGRTIERLFASGRVMDALHLPFQSGSDPILAEMNRGYTIEEFAEKIALVREIRPDIYLTTDIIVGYPGETFDDYAQTLAAIETIGFNDAFMFKYSPRRGTQAYASPDDVPEGVKAARLTRLIETQRRISRDANRRYVGRVEDALIEDVHPTRVVARTRFAKPVFIGGAYPGAKAGAFAKVRITDVRTSTFIGEWADGRILLE